MHLLTDSTGIKIGGEGKWNVPKHDGAKRRVRRKMHIGVNEKSLEIRAADFTIGDAGDAPMPPERPDQIPPEQEIASTTIDGAFSTCTRHDAIAARGAAAIIPVRKNVKSWKANGPGTIACSEPRQSDTGQHRSSARLATHGGRSPASCQPSRIALILREKPVDLGLVWSGHRAFC